MKKLSSYGGSLGIGFLLAGFLLWAMQRAQEIYWASFLIVGLVLTAVYIASRWSELAPALGSRSTREGANSALLIVIVVAIIGLINYIADEHAGQWDATATKQYSLSAQTTKILDELTTDIEIVLLDRRGSEPQIRAEDLLKLYDDASTRVVAETIDPESEPERTLAYTSPTEPLALGTIIIDTGERRGRATAATEPEITSALIRALTNETKQIYFTSGHQEKELLDTAGSGISIVAGKLADSAYDTQALVIARSLGDDGETLRIPDDAAAVVVAGPGTDFLQEELDALDAYIDGGGGVIFLIDPEAQGGLAVELVGSIVERGIVLGRDIVVDPLAQPPVAPVVESYGSHPIVESFGNVMSIFPLARSVTMGDDVPEGSDMRELFTTADENSWAETRPEELAGRGVPAPGQALGPIGLAMALTIAHGADKPPSRVVVVGDSDFIANELAAAPLLNADLFLNMVNWVAQDEDLISIRPREPEERSVLMSDQQRRNVFFLSLFIIPGIVIVTGVSLWWGRR
ncbi:MAG: Gldg family protein [Acidobacteriota bacterium]|nr:MAG: Gldg family protein [Acidobacteriota bacterium]